MHILDSRARHASQIDHFRRLGIGSRGVRRRCASVRGSLTGNEALTRARTVLSFAHRTVWPGGISVLEASLGRFDRQDRRLVAVVVTTDGRRVHVPIEPNGLSDVSLLELLRSLPGLDGLLGLITGSRRENGGTRRNER